MPEMSDALKALVMVGAFIGLIFISGSVWLLGGCVAETFLGYIARKRRERLDAWIGSMNSGAPEGGVRRRIF